MAETLAGSVFTPSCVTMCPRNESERWMKLHFLRFRVRPPYEDMQTPVEDAVDGQRCY